MDVLIQHDLLRGVVGMSIFTPVRGPWCIALGGVVNCFPNNFTQICLRALLTAGHRQVTGLFPNCPEQFVQQFPAFF
jgi:hypothetical protein